MMGRTARRVKSFEEFVNPSVNNPIHLRLYALVSTFSNCVDGFVHDILTSQGMRQSLRGEREVKLNALTASFRFNKSIQREGMTIKLFRISVQVPYHIIPECYALHDVSVQALELPFKVRLASLDHGIQRIFQRF